MIFKNLVLLSLQVEPTVSKPTTIEVPAVSVTQVGSSTDMNGCAVNSESGGSIDGALDDTMDTEVILIIFLHFQIVNVT